MGESEKAELAATQTTPKGAEIPVPKREDFLRDLEKVAPPQPKPPAAPDQSGEREA